MIRILMTGIAMAGVVAIASTAHAADKGGAYYDPVAAVTAPAADGAKFHGLSIEAGLGITSSNVDVGVVGGGTLATLGDSSWSGHLGIGYDWQMSNLVLGVFGRVAMNDLGYSFAGAKVGDTDVDYMLGGRIGWVPRASGDWMLYGLVAYKWADIDVLVPGVGDASANSWVIGGGIEAMLTDHVYLGAEITADVSPDGDTVGGIANVESENYAGTLRVGYRF